MGQDKDRVTQAMVRKWHETTFPGLSDGERAERIARKWAEESFEFSEALRRYFDAPTAPAFGDVREEAADVLLTLMGLAEFLGFNLTAEGIGKFNINTNRVWVQHGTDEKGLPIWVRERDNRPDIIR